MPSKSLTRWRCTDKIEASQGKYISIAADEIARVRSPIAFLDVHPYDFPSKPNSSRRPATQPAVKFKQFHFRNHLSIEPDHARRR